ncbi:MAG: hypothetical protein GW760_05295 [Legionella sp.]|jgi:hypothetical protein|nr:hypothetical protein [Legionella sp.]
MFSPFFDEFPELIHSEFRNVTILDNGSTRHIPPGNYAFCESFCTDLDCDCRNVFIHVISDNKKKAWAVLRYGWESKKFYKDWFGGSSELDEYFPGVVIDPLQGALTPMTEEFLELFKHILEQDKQYAKRIETHYKLFKEKISKKKNKQDTVAKVNRNALGQKIKRNDPCPCSSGKKYKQCCCLGELRVI